MSEPSHNQKTGTTLQPKAPGYGNVLARIVELLDRCGAAKMHRLFDDVLWDRLSFMGCQWNCDKKLYQHYHWHYRLARAHLRHCCHGGQ
jgi:hypothetical protein